MWDYVSDFDIFCWRSKNMLYFFVNLPWKRLSKNLLGIKGLSKTHKSSLNLKFFLKSTRPSLPLKKAPPLFPSPFPLRGQGMYQPPYSVLKPLRYKVGGPSEVFASSRAAVCGMRPHGYKSLRGCLVFAVHLEFLQQGNSNNKAVVLTPLTPEHLP